MDNYNFLEIVGIAAIGTIIFMTASLIYLVAHEYYIERKDKSKDKQ
jgi:hypothetical protein